ncbi:MAG: LamG-like jellyroll fold domain-containing protein [Planctomycetota bacterium]
MSNEDQLCDRVLDGTWSDDDALAFEAWLNEPGNLHRFALRAELHSDLRRALARSRRQHAAVESLTERSASRWSRDVRGPGSTGRPWSSRSIALVGVAAAACVAVFAFQFWSTLHWEASSGIAATVASGVESRIVHEGVVWERPELEVGGYELQAGLLHLSFDGGVMVYLEAPARFDLVSGTRVVLHDGRLSASVPPEGIGFTVDTPDAEVVDFGTEFSVDVVSGNSEVHVFEGLVRVQPIQGTTSSPSSAVDVREDQAVRIKPTGGKPVQIKLARDRFIRGFEEPRRSYVRVMRELAPAASYRMAIRDQGLVSIPAEHSGVVLTGYGKRPPHARGAFAGGALRVGGDSSGRGGRVDTPPEIHGNAFSFVAFVYLDEPQPSGVARTLVTNRDGPAGWFHLGADVDGRLRVAVRQSMGKWQSVRSPRVLTTAVWRHVIVTCDGGQLELFADGAIVQRTSIESMDTLVPAPLWFGTEPDGSRLWSGRIDEVAWFDRALTRREIEGLYEAAREEREALR